MLSEAGEIADRPDERSRRELLGLFCWDTRIVSRYEWEVGGRPARLLGARALAPFSAVIHQTAGLPDGPGTGEPLMLRRDLLISEGVFAETLCLSNHSGRSLAARLTLAVEAGFEDIFTLRGFPAVSQGQLATARRLAADLGVTGYVASDGLPMALVVRAEGPVLEADPPSARQAAGSPMPGRLVAAWEVQLRPGESRVARLFLVPLQGPAAGRAMAANGPEALGGPAGHRSWQPLARAARARRTRWLARGRTGRFSTGHPGFNALLERGLDDLYGLMCDAGPAGWPMAGVPYYAALFGRDSLWTAYFLLSIRPELARAVLVALAAHQASVTDPWRDAEPGKIPHELRQGEQARTGAVPFGAYYGSVDATPLFVTVAGAYLRRTGDRALLAQLAVPLERALVWITQALQKSHPLGFLAYHRRSGAGLEHQGWKDSWDAVWHADGSLPAPPVALAEVQGYAYRALRDGAWLGRLLGRSPDAVRALDLAAEALRERFERFFWLDSLGFYAHAVDGEGRPVAVCTSNPGHDLWAGLVSPARARRVGDQMLDPAGLFAGSGLRTVAREALRYHPGSYHNGSVWPHDTAIAVGGLMRYGLRRHASRLARALVEAGSRLPLARLPELWCGVQMGGQDEGIPVAYPGACAPQSWAAAAPFYLVAVLTGLDGQEDGAEPVSDPGRTGHGRTTRVHVAGRLPEWLGPVVRAEGVVVAGGRRVDVEWRLDGEAPVGAAARRASPDRWRPARVRVTGGGGRGGVEVVAVNR